MDKDAALRNLKATDTWIKGLYIIMFLIIYWVAEVVVFAVIFFQFVATLLSGRPMEQLADLGSSLARYIAAIINYVTFNSDERPYPFGDWPRPQR